MSNNIVRVFHVRPVPMGMGYRTEKNKEGQTRQMHTAESGEVREFSEAVHGSDYKEIAKEYATTHAANVAKVEGLDAKAEKEVETAAKKAGRGKKAEKEVAASDEGSEG